MDEIDGDVPMSSADTDTTADSNPQHQRPDNTVNALLNTPSFDIALQQQQTSTDTASQSSQQSMDLDTDMNESSQPQSQPQPSSASASASTASQPHNSSQSIPPPSQHTQQLQQTLAQQTPQQNYETIAILIDELMKEDPGVRIKAIRALPLIAETLGAQRTREELIPYITQMIDDDDEILLVLIEELYRLMLMGLVGNSRYYFAALIPPFERLCQVEEKLIRDEAILKFGQILMEIPLEQFYDYVLPLLQRLNSCDWHTARISGVTLLSYIFPKIVLLQKKQNDNKSKTNESQSQNASSEDQDVSMMDSGRDEKENIQSEANVSTKEDIFAMNDSDDFKGLNGDFIQLILKRRLEIDLKAYKKEIHSLLAAACEDPIPIVKRSALITLGKIVAVLDDKNEVTQSYLPLFHKLCQDEQDNVRVFAVETLLQFAHVYDKADARKELAHPIRELCIDSAWRVRYIAADNYIAMCRILDNEVVCSTMLDLFVELTNDDEAEVRAVAISKLTGMSRLIGLELTSNKLIPIVQQLVNDSNKYVRASLASVIVPFCHLLPHQMVLNQILPAILKILNDDFPNVRLHVISNICEDDDDDVTGDSNNASATMDVESNESKNKVDINNSPPHKKFDITLLQEALIPSIVDLTLDKNWRVRLGIVEKFPALAKQFGVQFFNDRVFQLALGALQDAVAEIRLAASAQLYEIAAVYHKIEKDSNSTTDTDDFGWAKQTLIPTLADLMQKSTHYLHRIVILKVYQYLCEGFGVDKNGEIVEQLVHWMEKDTVPNVRFKACQIVTTLASKNLIATTNCKAVIRRARTVATEDDDIDVRYFAAQASHALDYIIKRSP